MKFNIPIELKNKRGVYIIRNLMNRCVYVGQGDNFYTRYLIHRASLASGTHCNLPMQIFVKTHSLDKLEFDLLEVCEEERLDQKERDYIRRYKAVCVGYGFNVSMMGMRAYEFSPKSKFNQDILPELMVKYNMLRGRMYREKLEEYLDRILQIEEYWCPTLEEASELKEQVAKLKEKNKKLKTQLKVMKAAASLQGGSIRIIRTLISSSNI